MWRWILGAALAAALLCSPVCAENLLANSSFDTDVSLWTPNQGLDRMDWIGGDGNPTGSGPGCMELADTLNNGASIGSYQDVPVAPETTYEMVGHVQVPADSAGLGVTAWVYWYDESDTTIGYTFGCAQGVPADGTWREISCQFTSLPLAASARLWVGVQMAAAGTDESIARWDDISFGQQALFADGFEGGNAAAWSSHLP